MKFLRNVLSPHFILTVKTEI